MDEKQQAGEISSSSQTWWGKKVKPTGMAVSSVFQDRSKVTTGLRVQSTCSWARILLSIVVSIVGAWSYMWMVCRWLLWCLTLMAVKLGNVLGLGS